MKEKIQFLILGILIGAVITSGVFLIINKNSKPNFEKGDRMNGDFSNMVNDGTMPDRGNRSKNQNMVLPDENQETVTSSDNTNNNV